MGPHFLQLFLLTTLLVVSASHQKELDPLETAGTYTDDIVDIFGPESRGIPDENQEIGKKGPQWPIPEERQADAPIPEDRRAKEGAFDVPDDQNDNRFYEESGNKAKQLSNKVPGWIFHNPCQFPTKLEKRTAETLINRATKLEYNNCSDYKLGAEFQHVLQIDDSERFSLPYIRSENYICKAFIDGKEFIGFAKMRNWGRKSCVLFSKFHTIEVQNDFYVLKKPTRKVIWEWRDGSGTGKDLMNAVKLMTDGSGTSFVLGIAYFQIYVPDSSSREREVETELDGCPVIKDWKDAPEVFLVSGFVSSSNTSVMRFQFQREFYVTTQFQVLACTDIL